MHQAMRNRLGTVTAPALASARLRELGMRMKVWWEKDQLTRALAAGYASTDSRELALRAGQLTAKSTRASLAESVDDIVRQARSRRPALTSRVPFDRRKVRGVIEDLDELAARLRSDQPVRPQGVARVVLLLTDPEKPLYGEATKIQLLHAIIDATERLDWS